MHYALCGVQTMKNKLLLWILILLISFPIVFSVDVKLISSTPNCISCESIYSIRPDTASLSINENSLWFEFRKPATELMHGKDISTLRNWKVEMQDERLKEWTEQVLKDEGCTTKDKVEANGTTKVTTCNPVYETITKSVIEKYWKPIQDKELSIGKEIIIKVSGNIKVNSQVDNVLVLKEGSQYIKYTNWVWWNNSYSFKMPINCSLTTSNIPFVVNGSNGFTLGTGSTRQYVWTTCQASTTGIAVYYNNETSYTIANDTSELNFEVESGNITSTTRNALYASITNLTGVYHLKETSGTNILDSAGGNNNGTAQEALGSGINSVTLKIWKGLYFNAGANEYINLTANSPLTTGAQNHTVIAWVNASFSGDNKGIISSYSTTGFTFRQRTIGGTGYDYMEDAITRLLIPYTTPNILNMIAVSNTAGTGRMYFNGVLNQTGSSPQGTASGFYFASNAILWTGGLDEVQVYDKRILTATEILDTYKNHVFTLGYASLDASQNSTVGDTISYVVNYSSPVWELSNQSFWINLSWTGGVTDATALKLEYNNTNYSVAFLDNGSAWKRYNTSIIIPLTAGTSLADENRSFKFFYNFTNTTGTFTTSTSTSLQRVMESYFINSVSTTTNVPELSNASLVVNISQGVNANYSLLNWSVVLEFNGTNHTITTSTLNNETFNYTELIGVVITNNTRINHSAYLNLNWNGINASRSGFNPYNILLQNYFPTISNNGNITEGSISTVTVLITNLSGTFTTLSSIFDVHITWNGTEYQATQLNSTAWQYNHTAPNVNSNTNITQIGRLTLTYGSTSNNRSVNTSQTIFNFNINGTINCSPVSLFFTYLDELNVGNTNFTADTESLFVNDDTGENYTFNITGVHNQSFCVIPAFANLTITSWHLVKNNPAYYQREWRNKIVLSSSAQNKTIYLLNKTGLDATQTDIYITDGSGSLLPNKFVQVYKFDVANNTYVFTESIRTSGDGKGIISNLATAYYRFIVQDLDFNQIYESSTFKLTSTSIYLRIVETTQTLANLRNILSIPHQISWNNNTGIASFWWNDVEGFASAVCMRVINQSSGTYVSDACSTNTTGNLTYNLSSTTGTYIIWGYENGSMYIIDVITADNWLGSLVLDWGTEGLILGIIFFLSITMIGVGISPFATLIMADLSFGALLLFGFVHLNLLTFMSVLACTIIILYKITSKGGQ